MKVHNTNMMDDLTTRLTWQSDANDLQMRSDMMRYIHKMLLSNQKKQTRDRRVALLTESIRATRSSKKQQEQEQEHAVNVPQDVATASSSSSPQDNEMPKDLQRKIPIFLRKAESLLYVTAPSRDAYMDKSTLKDRLRGLLAVVTTAAANASC